MRTGKYAIFLLIVFFVSGFRGNSQVTVTGPACVIPGATYQYLISGPWDSASTMQVCLTGGLVVGSNAACTGNGVPVASVLVTWTASGAGNVNLSSSKGNSTLAVTISSVLTGGAIPVAVKTQSIAFKGTPSVITCSASTGGSCSPVYQYQWQQSRDRLSWTDISGAQGLTLSLSQPLQEATFFRRRVTEEGSGTIAYSDIAFVGVQAPPAGTILPN